MSDNNLLAIAQVSDASAVNRLFDILVSGNQNSQEFKVLDAIIYQRLMQNYEQAGEVPSQLDAVEASPPTRSNTPNVERVRRLTTG